MIVKVETSEPGLYGVGCASFPFRPAAVASIIEKYLRPFVVGRDPDMIEDLYKSMNVSSLWREGPTENYAVSGIDMALWDIKAKRANMPLYQFFGGKTRSAVQVYGDAGGRDGVQTAESVSKALGEGLPARPAELCGAGIAISPPATGMPLPDGPVRGHSRPECRDQSGRFQPQHPQNLGVCPAEGWRQGGTDAAPAWGVAAR